MKSPAQCYVARDAIVGELGFPLSAEVREGIVFGLHAALCANRPWELVLVVRLADAQLALRVDLAAELLEGGHDRQIAHLRDVPRDELAVCVFPPRAGSSPWVGAFRLKGLRTPQRDRAHSNGAGL